MLKKVVVLIVISLFFGAGVISNVIGDNLSENKLHNKDLVLSENCLLNNPPVISNPDPENGATVTIDFDELSFLVEDPDGDRINWTIETSPDIGSNFGILETNGSKYCSISNLAYATTYYWYVNATDGTYVSNMVYSFKTGNEPDYTPIIAEVYIDVVETIRGTGILVGIVNKIDEITEWNKLENNVSIKWYIQNEKELHYPDKSITINTRIREYQKDSAFAEILFIFTEGGRIVPKDKSRFIDININITNKSSEDEIIIPIRFTELDDMTMAAMITYLNFRINPFFSTRISVFHIVPP